MTHRPILIISGGQTGADIGCIRAAKCLGIPTGGYMPKGFKTELGPKPNWARDYGFEEHWDVRYPERTKSNVDMGHATLIISVNGVPEKGSSLTKSLCEYSGKPYLFLMIGSTSDDVKLYAPVVRKWLDETRPVILNCAGNRESISPGMEDFSKALILEVFYA